MAEYVEKVEGTFSPRLTRDYEKFTLDFPSFSVSVEKEDVIAFPHSGVELQIQEARERLHQEILLLLSVLSFQEGQRITFLVTRVVHPTLKELVTTLLVSYTVSAPVLAEKEMRQRTSWVMTDSVYRDLLHFYTEAQNASNPRPAGFNMVERLTEKYGNRQEALKILRMTASEIRPIVADQNNYQGDRHANFPVGAFPAPLHVSERGTILRLLRRIID